MVEDVADPADRSAVEVEVIQCVSLQGDRRAQGGMWHRVFVDGSMVAGVGMDLSFSWTRRTAIIPVELSAGVAHTIRYDRSRDWSEPAAAVPTFFVTSTVRSGVRVWDRGAIQ